MNTNLYTIYTKSNIVFLLCFLAIYILLSFIIGIFDNKNPEHNNKLSSHFFDVIIFVIFIVILVNVVLYNNNFYFLNQSYIQTDDPITLIASIFHIFIFYTIIYVFGIPMTYGVKSIAISLYEFLSWLFVLIVIISLFFKYFINIQISDEIVNIWDTIPSVSPSINTEINVSNKVKSNIVGNVTNEVFNIGNNLYTYDDAKDICTSYNAKLATYEDIEKSYNNGGEWCNYGWSEGQMIFFPTQKSTWNSLQKNPKTKNNCGRPGINGGYIDNPYLKFGVNCYGKRPTPTDKDIAKMNAQKLKILPATSQNSDLDNKVEFWKKNADKMLNINSFNTEKWSQY